VVVVVVGGDVVGVVVAGGEVIGVVGDGEVVGVGVRVVVVVELRVVVVVVVDSGPFVDEVPAVEEGEGIVVAPDGAAAELWAGFAVTSADHLPQVSVTFPFTCPAAVSPEKK